jgi:hypothetical protein
MNLPRLLQPLNLFLMRRSDCILLELRLNNTQYTRKHRLALPRICGAPNAAPEWQASSWKWRSRWPEVACPLEGRVRHSFAWCRVLQDIRLPDNRATPKEIFAP